MIIKIEDISEESKCASIISTEAHLPSSFQVVHPVGHSERPYPHPEPR
jgi:hypothetical protein